MLGFIHGLIVLPFFHILLGRQQLGPSCLGGVAVIIIMVPVNKAIAAWMGRLQSRLMKARDHRVEINNEVLGNMKGIKLQAWEDSFQKRIMALRRIELKHLFRYVMANSFSIMVSYVTHCVVLREKGCL
jgi:ATP-binding cassette subfamily C (CFTR/MRP) protein 1